MSTTFPNLAKESTKDSMQRCLKGPLAANVLSTLDRLKAAFHPNYVSEPPYPEWILPNYPAKREFFHGPDTLMEDTMNSDAERVSRASNDNLSLISHVRTRFSTLMMQLSKEADRRRESEMIAELENLGHEWGICEARITAVNQWYQMM